jgi:alpha-tubulin suppressor-like RCC1 family protein
LQPERLSLTKVVLVGAGSYHSCAVQQDGTVWAWGLNSFHQIGVETRSKIRQEIVTAPTVVATLSPTALNGRRVTAISGGEHHSLFLLSDGSVWGCGRCDGNELGLPLDHPAMVDIVAKRLLAGDVNRPIVGEVIQVSRAPRLPSSCYFRRTRASFIRLPPTPRPLHVPAFRPDRLYIGRNETQSGRLDLR